MNFCPGGDLSKLLDKYEKLSEFDSKIYVAEVLLALEALHRQNIIFRDLKVKRINIYVCEFAYKNLFSNKL